MKKSLLIVAALAATMSVNAQEVIYFGENLIGTLNGDATTDVAGETVLGETESITLYIGNDDSYMQVSINGPKDETGEYSYRKVIFDGETSVTETYITGLGADKGGIQGNSNPKDIDGGSTPTTFKDFATGAFFKITVNADGYVYVVNKMSSNKQYMVFEEGSALAYETAMGIDYETVAAYDLYDYADEYGYIYLEGDLASGVSSVQTITGVGSSNSGVGYIGFPVYEGCYYTFGASGSKMSALALYFSTEEVTSITLVDDDETLTELVLKGSTSSTDGEESGITSVKSAEETNAPIYNLAGQKVSSSAKGILIQNGKKFVNK